MFRKEFYEAWVYVPPLLVSVIFGSLTGFLGSICLAHKDSRSMGVATGIGAVANVAMNLMFIPKFGAMGAAVATAISYCIMWAMSYRFVRKHVYLENNLLSDILGYIVLAAICLAMIGQIPGRYVICAVMTVIVILLNYRDIKTVISVLATFVRSRIRGKN